MMDDDGLLRVNYYLKFEFGIRIYGMGFFGFGRFKRIDVIE